MQKGLAASQHKRAARGHGFLRKVLQTVPHMTLRRLVQVLFQNLVPQCIFDINVSVINKRHLPAAPSNPVDEAGIRWLAPDDVALLATARNENPDYIRGRLEEGHRAVVVEADNEIVGYNWFVPGAYNNGWLTMMLPPKCLFKSDIWIAPAHRGKGLAKKMSDFGIPDYRRQDFEFSFACVDALNKAALGHGKKTGSVTLDRLFYVRLFDWTLVRCRGSYRLGRWNEARPFIADFTDNP
jgi:GNAT superfamily N-acetyltransferase